ncbi:hypothetical protein GSH19_00435 [Lactobacillus sp. S2-2]|uniref:hypothetical protein n=1 Tax=Lactobacillus sp. S2-2 TaxID=2692917 RepID=UPI001F1DB216|nr:hypothetical protein [Lactobacillus sp. S2-2]MCF6514653.1 hypothetical protein [Lactobacillus sp. S2-2]
MISRVLSDSFITIKNNFKKIFFMSLPVIVFGLFFNGMSSSLDRTVLNSLDNLTDVTVDSVFGVLNNYIGLGLGTYILVLILSYLQLSLSMGYLKSDQEDNFEFKNAFALFLQKNTWWKIILISIVFSIAVSLVIGVFALLIFVSAYFIQSGLLTAIFIIGLIVLLFYIAITFGFNYLNYYDDINKQNKTGVFLSFKNVWNLISGYRGAYFGLMIIIGLLTFGFTSVFGLAIGIFSALFSLIPVIGSFLGWIVNILITLFGLIFAIYTNMVTIKFFKEIKK